MGLIDHRKISVLLLSTAYLFVVLTHISLLPSHHQDSSKSKSHYNSIFKRKLENANTQMLSMMHRTDKSVLNKDQDVKSLFLKLAGSFLIRFLIPLPVWQLRPSFSVLDYFSPNPVFLLTLRI